MKNQVNVLPMFITLQAAAEMDGSLYERCIYAAVHSWAEGHLAAPGHPQPLDTEETLRVPPFPHPANDEERLQAVVDEALERFEVGHDAAAIAFASALAWRLGYEEGTVCMGCAIEHGTSVMARAIRTGEMKIKYQMRKKRVSGRR